jgi:hypothetical protein
MAPIFLLINVPATPLSPTRKYSAIGKTGKLY